MAKIILGKRPATFDRTVTFPMLDGTTGQLDITFHYRTKKEWAKLQDDTAAARTAASAKRAEAAKADSGAALLLEDLVAIGCEADADYLEKIVADWNLEFPANAESFAQLCDELPAAAAAIVNEYRAAVYEGRLGN